MKDTPSPDDGKDDDVKIIHKSSISRNMFTRDSRKVLCIIK